MNQKDVIIVGAGISGLTAAKRLAKDGLKVLLIERKEKCKSKNFYSRLISTENLNELFNEIITESSDFIEREIKESRGYVIRDDSVLSLNCKSDERENKHKIFSVLWNSFINALIEDVKSSGVEVLLEKTVENLIVDQGNVIGVRTDDNEYYCKAVVLAEGAHSLIAKKQGLRKGEMQPNQLFLVSEEILSLPKKNIESIFNLTKNDGIAIKFYTNFSNLNNVMGIGHLYSNSNTLSFGVGVLLSDLILNEININDYLNAVKECNLISSMLSFSKIKTTLSYTLPAQIRAKHLPLPALCVDGCVVVGGASTLVNPFSYVQSTLAALTGKYAAEAIIGASRSNDFSRKTLSKYIEFLFEDKAFQNFNSKIANNGVIERGIYVDKNNDEILDSLSNLVFKG